MRCWPSELWATIRLNDTVLPLAKEQVGRPRPARNRLNRRRFNVRRHRVKEPIGHRQFSNIARCAIDLVRRAFAETFCWKGQAMQLKGPAFEAGIKVLENVGLLRVV